LITLLMMLGISRWWYSRGSSFTLGWPVEWLYGGFWWPGVWPATSLLSTHVGCSASPLATVTSTARTRASVGLLCLFYM